MPGTFNIGELGEVGISFLLTISTSKEVFYSIQTKHDLKEHTLSSTWQIEFHSHHLCCAKNALSNSQVGGTVESNSTFLATGSLPIMMDWLFIGEIFAYLSESLRDETYSHNNAIICLFAKVTVTLLDYFMLL